MVKTEPNVGIPHSRVILESTILFCLEGHGANFRVQYIVRDHWRVAPGNAHSTIPEVVNALATAVVLLPVAQYPEITPPTVQVNCTYPGASSKVVAETVGRFDSALRPRGACCGRSAAVAGQS
jgi:hypothetical protein